MRKRSFKLPVIVFISIALIFILNYREVLATDIVSSGTYGDGFKWTLDSEKTLTLSGSGDASMGEMGEGISYEQLHEIQEAVKQCKKLVISEGITSVCKGPEIGSFFYNTNIEEVIFPASINSIGGFAGCRYLKTVSIPKNSKATTIQGEAFARCTSLTRLTLPDSITSIGSEAFRGCSSLQQINIPDSVTFIAEEVFTDCKALKSITIPNSVTEILGADFVRSGIKKLIIPESLGSSRDLLVGSYVEEVVFLPKKVDKYFFRGAESLETVVFGNELSKISNNAFDDCDSLNNIVFMNDYDYNSKTFENLSDVAIYRKHAKNKVTLEEFSSGTKNVVIPSEVAGYTVTKIGEYTFDSNKYVRTVKLPAGIESIGPYAFYNCSKLNKITLNSGLTSIGKFAFYGCNSIESLKLPDTLRSIGERAFWNCYSLSSLKIPPAVTTIGANAFESCTGLTTVTIGETATKVSEVVMPMAYAGTTKKTTYISIKKNAFSKCKNLKKVVIGAKVKSIGKSAFYKCTGLKNITIKTKKLKSSSIGSNAFKGINKNATFKIPKSKYKTYKNMLLKKGATGKMKFKKL